MKLKLDTSKTYAIALEGGGAKGGYEIGVWRALEEMGIRYNAVSGTSVGALNGAMMAMRDLPRARAAWEDIRLDKVIDLDADQEENLAKVLSGEMDAADIQQMIPQAFDVIRNRGLDVAPLREWVRETVDCKKIKESDVALFVAAVSITDRKGLEIKVNDLPEDEICDMLLASAYHPTFRLERLGGKLYADGGFIDSLPLHVLVENGYKDIIAVRIPSRFAHQRRFKIPPDVSVSYVDTSADLGGVLNFTAAQARRDMAIGYLDAYHDLCGLYGEHYYIDRTMTEREALDIILDSYMRGQSDIPIRELCEKELPRLAKRLGATGGYYELLIALLETAADGMDIEKLKIYTDREFLSAIAAGGSAAAEEEAE